VKVVEYNNAYSKVNYVKIIARIFIVVSSILLNTTLRGQQNNNPEYLAWTQVLSTADSLMITDSTAPVRFSITDRFLGEPGIKRRDPSDVIYHNGNYYVWYSKVHEGDVGYPGGWSARVWYASSPDGHNWTEKGIAIDIGTKDDWDGYGVYTPNILVYEDKFYLAYTAIKPPFIFEYSMPSIGMAIAYSPDGPWEKLENNPIIPPGEGPTAPDGFLADDASFVIHEGKVLLYYKGCPYKKDSDGKKIREGNTFLMVASATNPEGPYAKYPIPLHRGHESLVWKDENGFGSFNMYWWREQPKYFRSKDGFNFIAICPLPGFNGNDFMIRAAGVFRANFNENRPCWGICMSGQGLARFEIEWSE